MSGKIGTLRYFYRSVRHVLSVCSKWRRKNELPHNTNNYNLWLNIHVVFFNLGPIFNASSLRLFKFFCVYDLSPFEKHTSYAIYISYPVSFSIQSCRSCYATLHLCQRPFYKIFVKFRNSKKNVLKIALIIVNINKDENKSLISNKFSLKKDLWSFLTF